MRIAGKPEFNPATASQANYATLHNGAHLNVVMQITLAIFFYGSESQPCWEELEPIMRMKHCNFFFFEQKKVRGGNTLSNERGTGESSQLKTKQAKEDVFFSFYLPGKEKNHDQLCGVN